MPATDAPLPALLDAWQKAIGDHQPAAVAELFTPDAIFQGLRPYSVGPAGVEAYYASQPLGMAVTYRLVESRPLADEVVLGWVEADFSFTQPDRAPILVNLTVVARRTAEGWRIAHYHVSPRPGAASTPAR